MQKDDLDEADNIVRLAFGTFLGMPDPSKFMGDADFVRTRFTTDPSAALSAKINGKLVGSNFLLNWGSIGVFGPLSVHPDFWQRGVAKKLLEQTMKIFQNWGTSHVGLFTFAQSSKHIHLYQRFGFWPRYLTAIMSKQSEKHDFDPEVRTEYYSQLSSIEKNRTLERCSEMTDKVYAGLDLSMEITAVDTQDLGDTLLIHQGKELVALAICHSGAGTEAGSGNTYIKFGAVSPQSNSLKTFDALMDACEVYALSLNAPRLVGGANSARHLAYRRMMERGFRTDMLGVTMDNPNEPAYNSTDNFIIDDWR